MKPLIRLSQGQLNILESCPAYFQEIFLDQRGTPLDPIKLENTEWGSHFHQLMQQKELNLPIDYILTEDPQLHRSLEALMNASPELFNSSQDVWREAEHHRTLQIDHYLLTVVYDLLIAQKDHAQIIDWKTYLKPKEPKVLQQNWQTRLYLYVLAESSNYPPEQLSMTYWFVKLPTQPQKFTISYNQQLHQQTKADLTDLLNNLTQWLYVYNEDRIPFPHHHPAENCPFAKNTIISDSDSSEPILSADWQTMIDSIEEIPL
jgi:hypothetical protein